MCASPLPSCLNGSGLVVLPALGNIVGERVVGIGSTEEGLDREEDSADLEGGGPVVYIYELDMKIFGFLCNFLTLQDIQADPAKTIDVGVVDLGEEANLGGSHRIVIGQEEFKSENAT